MALINFVSRITRITAAWLNKLDYTGQQRLYNHCTCTGSANTYTVTTPSSAMDYVLLAGTTLRFKPSATNTGASTVNGVAVINELGNALTGGEVNSLGYTTVKYTGTVWQLVNPDITADKTRTPAELVASVTPVNYYLAPGNDPPGLVERYGNTGTSDDGPTINNAIKVVAPGHGTVQLSDKTYNLQTPIDFSFGGSGSGQVIFRGMGRRVSLLKWTGGASKAFTIAANGNDSNCVLEDFGFDNTGTATHFFWVTGVRVVMQRIFTSTSVGFTTAALSTNTAATVFDFVMRDCQFYAADQTGCSVTQVYLARGHTFIIDHCMMSSAITDLIKVGGAGGQPAQGVTIIGSRHEGFSGNTPSYPGSNTTIGINVVNSQGLSVIGSNFEMDADQFSGANGQRAIKLTTCDGGAIHGNYMAGNGFTDYAIEFADVAAKGLDVRGNTFWRQNINGITTSGTGSLLNNEIGLNYSPSPTLKEASFAYTPVLTFTGGTGTLAYTSQGYARRVGDWIEYQGEISLSSKGTAAGNPRISSPVISTNETGNDTVFTNYAQAMTTVTTIQVAQFQNTNTIRIFDPAGTELTIANFTNTSYIVFSGRIYCKI